MRKLLYAGAALLALCGSAFAGRGDHLYLHYVPYGDGWNSKVLHVDDTYRASPAGPSPSLEQGSPHWPTAAEQRAKALEAQRVCAPVREWTDQGTTLVAAKGCR